MTDKCAHPACGCLVPEERMYCSDKCTSGNPTNAKCDCGHPGCKSRWPLKQEPTYRKSLPWFTALVQCSMTG
jgi:hypothetical protein